MCPNCKGTGYDKGTKCGCTEDPCIHTVHVQDYVDPWSREHYAYKGDGHCPVCGGDVIINCGDIYCVDPGNCTYSAEIIEEG